MDMLVSSALEAGSSLPSFFEMVMTQQVELSLKPVVRHAHMALATRWPQLHRLSRWFDEGYLVLLLLVEGYFLSKHSCLLSESFYGLRRCRYGPVRGPPGPSTPHQEDAHLAFDQNGAGYGPGQSLRSRDRRKALLTAVVLPYLLAKLDAGHERDRARRNQATQDATGGDELRSSPVPEDSSIHRAGRRLRSFATAARIVRDRARARLRALRSLFFQVYPLLRASYEGSALVYQWLYLFRRSAFFSPALRLTGMVVRRTTYEDLEEDAAARAAASSAPPLASSNLPPAEPGGGTGGGAGGPGGGETRAPELAGEVVDGGGGAGVVELLGHYGRVLLVTAVVAFKVVEWWTRVEAQEGPSWRRAQLPPPPPPPRPPAVAPSGCGVPADAGACPICGAARVNSALCAPSGFVFCYLCIARHVREHGECPVTGLPCSGNGIVRLYDDD